MLSHYDQLREIIKMINNNTITQVQQVNILGLNPELVGKKKHLCFIDFLKNPKEYGLRTGAIKALDSNCYDKNPKTAPFQDKGKLSLLLGFQENEVEPLTNPITIKTGHVLWSMHVNHKYPLLQKYINENRYNPNDINKFHLQKLNEFESQVTLFKEKFHVPDTEVKKLITITLAELNTPDLPYPEELYK
jgi:hypothetical protein